MCPICRLTLEEPFEDDPKATVGYMENQLRCFFIVLPCVPLSLYLCVAAREG